MEGVRVPRKLYLSNANFKLSIKKLCLYPVVKRNLLKSSKSESHKIVLSETGVSE